MLHPRSPLTLPHGDARRRLAAGALVYLPVNPIEYHGPHLSLRNDGLISAGMARDLHRGLEGRWPGYTGTGDQPLLLDDLDVGVDPVPGPGTRPVSLARASQLVVEAAESLADLGAKRVVFMTFHGSPLHAEAIERGVCALRRRGVRAVNPFNHMMRLAVLGGLKELAREAAADLIAASQELDEALGEAIRFDYHGGLIETSLALRYAPESVDPCYKDLPPCPEVRPPLWMRLIPAGLDRLGLRRLARETEFSGVGATWYGLRPFPGYTGSPHLASTELAQALTDRLFDEMVELVRDVLEGAAEPPPPMIRWLKLLSLGGYVPLLPQRHEGTTDAQGRTE